jgi:hypothetical protein
MISNYEYPIRNVPMAICHNLARYEDLTVIAIKIMAFCLIVMGVSEKRAACIFKIDDGGSTFLGNVGNNLPDYMASHPRRPLPLQ